MNPFQNGFGNNNYRKCFHQNNIGKSVIFSTIQNHLSADRKIHLIKKLNNHFENKDLSITFFFLLMTGNKYQITAKTNDIFQNVLDKFLLEQCLSDFKNKNKIRNAMLNAKLIDNSKTLSENEIKEGSKVIIITAFSNDMDQFSYNAVINEPAARPILSESKFNKNSTLTLDDEDKKLLMNIYEYVKKCHNLIEEKNQNPNINLNININLNLNINQMKNKNSCKINGSKCFHIHIKKHEHGLILCYTNRNWVCNICREKYSKDESTYYCSLCDFDVCNCCIGILKKYPLKQFYHQQTNLKYFTFNFHEHRMIYCRTSRNFNSLSTWFCDKCKKEYSNKIWSFYCTNCDYDICLKCSKNYINKELLINNIGINIDNHPHKLIYMKTNRNWICNLCREKYNNDVSSYYCTKCDYDVCKKCMNEISDEKKYPILDDENKESYSIDQVKINCHRHPLMYCVTSRSSKSKTSWICNECRNSFYDNEWSFYCSICDYDICYNCYESERMSD